MRDRLKELYEQIRQKSIHPDEAIRRMNELRVQSKEREQARPVPVAEQEEIYARALAYFKQLLSSELKLPAHQIEDHAPLEKYGVDSVMVLRMTALLENRLGPLSKTLFFEYQTLSELTRYLLDAYPDKLHHLLGMESVSATGTDVKAMTADLPAPPVQERLSESRPEPNSADPAGKEMDIAIIGVAGKYPGAENISDYWNNLKAGKDSITEIPEDRWDYRAYFDKNKDAPGKTNSKWGGFLDGVYQFDPLFFNIPPREAERMDPQERLFLQCAYEALEDAGYTRETCRRYNAFGLEGNVGVFVGVMYEEYQLFGAEEQAKGRPLAIGGNPASIANRVSYYFNFHGPSMAVDTMCSSSLTSIHLACRSLQRSECEMAIAGGVNVSVHPNKYLFLGRNHFLSSKGKCESFGEGGDGYVPGEGVGAILLKPLGKAIEDRDPILGVVKSTAINHGGKTNGYTVPNPNAQAEVMKRAYRDTDVSPRAVSYLEAHGTGTALGDPIEIAGLNKAFGEYTDDKHFCKIGSVKSNIGHCESAAGIAGVTKVLLQMKHGLLVPSIHAETLNPHIDFADTPFVVQRELEEWRRPLLTVNGEEKEYPRVAGISSFGAGGSNAHVVIEEYVTDGETYGKASPVCLPRQLFVISAKNEARLRENALRIQHFIGNLEEDKQTDPRLFNDIAYTLQVGREAMPERMAVVASSLEEVGRLLLAYGDGTESEEQLYRGSAKVSALHGVFEGKASEQFLRALMHGNELHKLAELWVSGVGVDWEAWYQPDGQDERSCDREVYRPRRMSLPGNSFANETYFVGQLPGGTTAVTERAQRPVAPETSGGFYFAPKWERTTDAMPYEVSPNSPGQVEKQTVWIISNAFSAELGRRLEELHPGDEVVQLGWGAEGETYASGSSRLDAGNPACFEDAVRSRHGGRIDRIYYLDGGDVSSGDRFDLEYLHFRQEQGVIGLFRLIKTLADNGYGTRKITFKIVTDRVYSFSSQEAALPYGAGLFGLAKSMSREFMNWRVTGLDVDLAGKDLQALDSRAALTHIRSGTLPLSVSEVAVRDGAPYIRKLYPIELPPVQTTSFKAGGVYMLAGGAGGIGIQLCLHVAERISCSFALIGRREPDKGVQEALELVRAKGSQIIYLQGDLTDPESMERAVQTVKSTYGKLNGVIHAAIVLRDQTIANMEEDTFRKVLAPKITGSVTLHRALRDEQLDFMMYFSSAQSFIGNAGQSNYAAGSAFKDAFALYEHATAPYPVKVVNWGYWGEVGVVASEEYGKRLAAQGVYAIKIEEGMDAIERVLHYDGVQMMAMKAERNVMEAIGADYAFRIETCSQSSPSLLSAPLDLTGIPKLKESDEERLDEAFRQMRLFTPMLLLKAFQKEGLFTGKGEQRSRVAMLAGFKIVPKYERLFRSMLDILMRAGYIAELNEDKYTGQDMLSGDQLKRELLQLEQSKERICGQYPQVATYMELLWTCSPHLWAILKGERLATDILFPHSSMKLVENIYKDNPLSDYLNQIVTWSLRSYIGQAAPKLPGSRKVRVLEIGAGTGGTSSAIFKGLREHRDRLAYDYTDLSEAFLKHGKANYGADNPNVNFRLLNIEKDVLEQGFAAGDYDVVIATNVLHATTDIRQTLRHAKMLLKKNGLLILNEIVLAEDFLTLTFGLLDGWWMYADEHRRLPNSPLLSGRLWKQALEEEGYRHIRSLGQPGRSGMELTQNVIISEGDGEIRFASGNIPPNRLPQRADTGADVPGIRRESRRATDTAAAKAPVQVSVQKEISAGELADRVESAVLDSLSEVLQMDKDELDLETPYSEYGVDSILSGQIVNRMNDRLLTEMNSIVLFNYPTTSKLRDYIVGQYGDDIRTSLRSAGMPAEAVQITAEPAAGNDAPAPAEAAEYSADGGQSSPAPTSSSPSMDIAIVGMSGRFPGADHLDDYWDNLVNGRNSVTEIGRWDERSYYDPSPGTANKSYINRTGQMKDMDCFDPLFFNISPKEAELMDPQQRVFLEEAWKALEDAGFSDRYLEGRKCGVFVGCMESYYEHLIAQSGAELSSYIFTGITISMLSARISYMLNLRGPSIVASTACSSASVALHLACESILNKTSEMAVAGGVNLFPTPLFHTAGSSTGMFSYAGECRPFDDKADGFMPAEGCGAVVLKALDRAIADGDHIYGVIVGSSINQDGKSNGITAPSAPSQAALESEVYRKYNINPEHISYIEAHGTGTKLGDPIEIEALREAFGQFTDKKQFCPIGSVKSNIGHALEASGMASLIKVLLCMKHKKLVPSVLFDTENALIPFADSPVYVNTAFKDWTPPEGAPRMAAISSFGISGTNSHFVVREYEDAGRQPAPARPYYLVALSAKTEPALKQRISDLADWLEKDKGGSRLGDIEHTLMMGRSHFSYRSAFLVRDLAELKAELALALNGTASERHIEGGFIAAAFRPDIRTKESGQRMLDELGQPPVAETAYTDKLYADKLMHLARIYAEGYALDWAKLYGRGAYRKLSMPTYPFARERYWVEPAQASRIPEGAHTARLHPLIERNTATLKEQRYTTLFRPDEFYIAGHEVAGQKVMPGAVYLEMARAAGEIAAEEPVQTVRQVIWGSPIVVEEQREVHLTLHPGDDGLVDFEVYTQRHGHKVSHAQGTLAFEQGPVRPASLNVEAIKSRCTETVSGEECYRAYRLRGFGYNGDFQTIQHLHCNGSEALAALKLPGNLLAEAGDFMLHPSIMDGALQSAIALADHYRIDAEDTYVPFLIEEVQLFKPLTAECYAYVTASGESRRGDDGFSFDIVMAGIDGEVLAAIGRYHIRKLTNTPAAQQSPVPETALELLKLLENGDLNAKEAEKLIGGFR